MTEPLRVPGDGALAIKDYLAETLPAIAATQLTAGLGLPANWTKASKPHIAVFDDSGPMRYPILTKTRIRIVTWSNARTTSRRLAGLALAVVLTHRMPGVATVIDPSSPIDGLDPNNQGITAEFYVTANVRTIAV